MKLLFRLGCHVIIGDRNNRNSIKQQEASKYSYV